MPDKTLDDRMLDIVLDHVGKHAEEAAMYKDLFKRMCSYYISLMEGDTLYTEEAYKLMEAHGIVDEDGEEIYDEDEG